VPPQRLFVLQLVNLDILRGTEFQIKNVATKF
jgi:hypothetical protein